MHGRHRKAFCDSDHRTQPIVSALLVVSFGRQQMDDTAMVAQLGPLRCLNLERLGVRLAIHSEKANGTVCLIESILHVDAPYVSLKCDVGGDLVVLFKNL
jgi:hypothetical protein